MNTDHSRELKIQDRDATTGVLLQDAGTPVEHGDPDDNVRLRPAKHSRELGCRLAKHVGGCLHAGQYQVGSQLAKRLGEGERRSRRVIRVDLARFDYHHAIGPARKCHEQRLLDPVPAQSDGRHGSAGGLLDQHRLFERLVVELVDHHLYELAIDVGAARVHLELVTRLRHQPYRDRNVHRRPFVAMAPDRRRSAPPQETLLLNDRGQTEINPAFCQYFPPNPEGHGRWQRRLALSR